MVFCGVNNWPSLGLLFWTTAIVQLVPIIVGSNGPCALLEPRADALCIPLASINRAFHDARLFYDLKHPLQFPPHKIQEHIQDIDLLGLVLIQTTKFLQKEFHLTNDQVEHLLPKLDLELTDIWRFCPENFRHRVCQLSEYREITGHCNNLKFPEWGAAFTPFNYLLPPDRQDGVDYPKDPDNSYLPPARLVSSLIHQDRVKHDHTVTVMLLAWGQAMDHDITLTAESKDAQGDPNCCKYLADGHGTKLHHNCFPIIIPHDDEYYSEYNQQCMNFLRSSAAIRPQCRLGPRRAINSVSSFIDASFVYGSDKHTNNILRAGEHGLLATSQRFHKYGMKDLLPPNLHDPDGGCLRPDDSIHCFLAGDSRVNEQLVLTVLHTVFLREHNRIALELSRINPHWEDERIFQETRRIIIAIVQHVTVSEFLPLVLGHGLMYEHHLSIKPGYWNGYDPLINPMALEEFITSAFRFGHSLLPQKIERWSKTHHFIDATDLHHHIRKPFDLYNPGKMDTYILGMVNQLAQAMDEGVTDQVTNLLFKTPHKPFGMDLASMNLQRGRDHAIRGYTSYRQLCGLSPVTHWDDLLGVMRNETIHKHKRIYRLPSDIDLWSGGVSEIQNHGSLVGPTFACIIAKQFHALRHGDRYWYELPNLPSSFTEEQLVEIKKIMLSRILCDNGDNIKSLQFYPMAFADPKSNPRVPCQGSVIPRLDLRKWKDHHHHVSSHQLHDPSRKIQDNYVTLHAPVYDLSYISNHTNWNKGVQEITGGYPFPEPSYGSEQGTNHDYEYQKANSYGTNDYHQPNNFDVEYMDEDEDKALNDVGPFHSHDSISGPEIMEIMEPPSVNPPWKQKATFMNTGHSTRSRPSPWFSYNRNLLVPKRRRAKHITQGPAFPMFGMDGIFSPNPGLLVRKKPSITPIKPLRIRWF